VDNAQSEIIGTVEERTDGPDLGVNVGQAEVLSHYEALASDRELDPRQLVGDIRDTILDFMRHKPKPYDQLPENEQRDLAWDIESGVGILVRRAVALIAAEDRPSVPATLKQVTGKNGSYKVSLEAVGTPEMAAALARLDGHEVLIISSDSEPYAGRAPAATRPDQMPMEFAEAEQTMTGGGADDFESPIPDHSHWELDFPNAEANLVNNATGAVIQTRPATADEMKAEQERLQAAKKPRKSASK
jgi:hypothetical protein